VCLLVKFFRVNTLHTFILFLVFTPFDVLFTSFDYDSTQFSYCIWSYKYVVVANFMTILVPTHKSCSLISIYANNTIELQGRLWMCHVRVANRDEHNKTCSSMGLYVHMSEHGYWPNIMLVNLCSPNSYFHIGHDSKTKSYVCINIPHHHFQILEALKFDSWWCNFAEYFDGIINYQVV
jgi:hypothetical protein